MVHVTCPHCRFYWSVEEFFLPMDGTEVICRSCKDSFTFNISQVSRAETIATSSPTLPEPLAEGSAGEDPPPLDEPSIAESERVPETFTFEFTGSAKEYFGIWIVNTLLRIVTVGIYSPWAKVRKRRYFYSNTLLNGAPFDYLADPFAILKGWLLAAVCIGIYSFCTRSYPMVAPFMGLAFGAVYPWVLVRSVMFNCFNSAHRNIRFRFNPDYRGALREYLWMPLLSIPTLGLLYPYVMWRQKRFLVENSSYGTTPFSFDVKPKSYYRLCAPLLVLVPFLFGVFSFLISQAPKVKDVGLQAANPLLAFVPLVTMLFIYCFAGVYLPTVLANLVWSGTSVGDLQFSLRLRVRDMAWIYVSNAFAILFTFGLLAPWAAVRLARYRLSRMSVTGVGLDSVTATSGAQIGASGEELGDLLGLDFGV